MGDKIIITKDGIIQRINSKYEEICNKINMNENLCDLKTDIIDFYNEIDNAIVSFFLLENAGDGIKKLYNRCDSNPVVSSINFEFAFNQYKEYLTGMKKYIDDSKQKDLSDPEIINTINNIITKDDDFIRSIFVFGENKNNAEVKVNLNEALECLNTLFCLRNTISEFKQEPISNSILDKLAVLSKIKMVYFASTEIFNQIARIAGEVNGDCNEPCEKPVYAVF